MTWKKGYGYDNSVAPTNASTPQGRFVRWHNCELFKSIRECGVVRKVPIKRST